MSMIRPNGQKVVLPRSGTEQQWDLIFIHYAKTDLQKWRYLAMLALKESAGWPLDGIGNVFDHPKGHISRCLAQVKRELRARFSAQERCGVAESEDEFLAA
ncbi:hypothetical protein Pan44_01590 [Caulifigura coniformis]|uniref:Uncharacterized protein n=1 Tax=Caulifigura coniformis TaxID=2527983 RepID=A0A517S7P6_9PLAN|nr:hypothetical protein [Caulifigura coniformis]QDT52150.1 hypothetical protein Pan44_01590 [Caulifigura coniformis]